MADFTFPQRFQMRGDTALTLYQRNEVLKAREYCVETDTGRFKVGDGSTPWNDLLYAGSGLADLTDLADGSVLAYNSTLGYFVPTFGTTDGDKGDVTVSASGATWTIDNDVVTYAKMQNVSAASKLLGRGDSGSGDPQEITLGSGLSMSGTTLNAVTGSGALTYVGTATVAGSAATTLSISGLDMSTATHYIVELVLDNALGGTIISVSMYYNSDTTATNYYRQALNANGTSVTAARANDAVLFALAASDCATGVVRIANDRDSKPRAYATINRDLANNIRVDTSVHTWTSATNITGITLSASAANAFAVGSFMRVYRMTP